MNDYRGWNERIVSVTSLLLDTRNPRIPEFQKEPSQRDIVRELIEHDNVYELAKDISVQGYFPTEVLIGVHENGGSTVVEGNRRLAAVKLLISPELAPDGKVAKFRTLQSRTTADNIKKVRVTFAPSREAAAPLIINRHTQTGIERWKPAQQAKFVRTLATPDMEIGDLAEQLGMTRSQLVDNLRTDTMYRIACRLDLLDDILSIVRNPRAFNTSVLERLVQSSKAMEFLGVKIDDRGNIVGNLHVDEFKKAYGRMVSDIASGKQDTRSLNSSQEIEKYLDSFGTDAPDRKRKGNFDSRLLLAKYEKGTADKETRTDRAAAIMRESAYLIPSGVKCRIRNPRINDIFKELKELKVDKHRDSVAVLLRILVELLAGHYLDKTGKIEPLLQSARKKGKGSDWYPTLRQMLATLMSDEAIKLKPLVRKGMNKMISNDDHPLSLDKMDQFVHNRYVAPEGKELRKMWALLEDLVRQLLVEPIPAAG